MASGLDPRPFKGPGERPKLGEGFLDPGSIKISLLLSGKVAKAFLTDVLGIKTDTGNNLPVD
ncbi:hypothetical protein DSO57_1001764 [Entomophthora muscae]|uniref:Uncharacterized protein n=1 Tax=Entomophthora muscae TaxID=34485 RepID=A0ACC2T8N4_9FUNG|nr:hypothetical protein DSO57_1001764 [Entomophthora muscae]